jgi:Protein of unknown function (DUF2786)
MNTTTPIRFPQMPPSTQSEQFYSAVKAVIDEGVSLAIADRAKGRQFTKVIDDLMMVDGRLLEGSVSTPIDPLINPLIDPLIERPIKTIETLVMNRISKLWEMGWQPLDLVHVIRRETTPRIAQLAICALGSDRHLVGFVADQPAWWVEQIETTMATLSTVLVTKLKGSSVDLSQQPFDTWLSVSGLTMPDLLEDALLLLAALTVLRPLARITEPPSRWKTTRVVDINVAPTGGDAPARTLGVIRGLLAKAEATTFAAEAESFAEKAQELMTKYSIDIAMLDDRHGEDLAAGVVVRRFQLDQPYAKEKYVLLVSVGSVNQVRVVFDSNYGLADAFGFADDLDMTDLLFTSLLVQASHALNETVAKGKLERSAYAQHQSSPAFRRAFWLSYAARIVERLSDAQKRATAESAASYGDALVPVLQERTDAVNTKLNEAFPKLKTMKTRSVDAAGWHAGRDAADTAQLNVPKGRIGNR